ncbi:MAG: hypothetical protein COB78_10735 [Hyphomicrobiales bacterium]|nr:MAG: hypothetical protein COB78_10735 [Hyphomicrobiales bacterium]
MGSAHKMSNIIDAKDAPVGVVITAAFSVNWWEPFIETVTKVDSALIMFGGLIVLFLTIISKVQDIMLKRRQLRDDNR